MTACSKCGLPVFHHVDGGWRHYQTKPWRCEACDHYEENHNITFETIYSHGPYQWCPKCGHLMRIDHDAVVIKQQVMFGDAA